MSKHKILWHKKNKPWAVLNFPHIITIHNYTIKKNQTKIKQKSKITL